MAAVDPYEVLVYDADLSPGSRVYTTPTDNPAEMRAYRDQTKETLTKLIMPLRSSACQGNVDESYISRAISKNDFVMLLYRGRRMVAPTARVSRSGMVPEPVEVPNEPLGFVLARRDPKGSDNFYIDVICSVVGHGLVLLKYFHAFARTKGARSVTLSSLPSVLAYYTKFGYQFRKSCDAGTVVVDLPETITTYLRETKQRPVTTSNVYEIEPYMDFMEVLHAQGFGVKKEGECGKSHVSKDEIKAKDCGGDGYTMMKCDVQTGGKRRGRRTHNNRRKRRTTRRRSHRQ